MTVKEENVSNNKAGLLNDFIYNRFDLYDENVRYLTVEKEDRRFSVQYSVMGDTARLGIWLTDIDKSELSSICGEIFKCNKNVDRIEFSNSVTSLGESTKKNHFRISLPKTVEELEQRLSKKGRYNIKRELKLIGENIGECEFKEYRSENVPSFIFDSYFQMKSATHGVNYGLTAEQYISKYHVSDIYALFAGEELCAVLLSCEQCPIVYIENLTYSQNAAQYSPGQVIYDYYLKRLVEKGFEEIYLAGGDLDYKKRYGSVEETVYDCIVFRRKISEYYDTFVKKMKKIVKRLIGRE